MDDAVKEAREAAVLAYDKSPALHSREECNEIAMFVAISAYEAKLAETTVRVPREDLLRCIAGLVANAEPQDDSVSKPDIPTWLMYRRTAKTILATLLAASPEVKP